MPIQKCPPFWGYRGGAQRTSVRKLMECEVTTELFALLTTDPSEAVKSVQPAMSVILTEPAELEIWMGAEWAFAMGLQRTPPDGAPTIL